MSEHVRVAIIGAGGGGLATAVGLLRDGCEDFVVLEQAPRVGGTWYHNRYPGAECDSMSHLYSFSFALNPRWTRRYAQQPEILAYFEDVVERFGVTPHLRLSTAVRSMRWDEGGARWHLVTDRGELTADVVVSGVGMFNEPAWPSIDGLDRFAGPVIHTARWPEGERLEGKRVSVIGTAASAVQLIPELAKTVEQLHVFQRTPVWVIPKVDDAYTPEEIEAFVQDPSLMVSLRQEIEERANRVMCFKDEEYNRTAVEGGALNRSVVEDPELRRKLTPTLPFGSRRSIVSNHYYPAFNRPNVELVTDGIDRVESGVVVTTDGVEREVDAIVCATGFATTKYLAVIDVTGRDGRKLAEEWAEEPRAYYGVMAPGYPNLVMLYGPNTNNGSILTMLETQAAYAVRHIRWMTDNDIVCCDVRPEVVEAYNEQLQVDLDTIEPWRVESGGYYRGRSGRIVTQWPHSMADYERCLEAISPEVFEVGASRHARG